MVAAVWFPCFVIIITNFFIVNKHKAPRNWWLNQQNLFSKFQLCQLCRSGVFIVNFEQISVFWYFYRWLWTNKYRIETYVIELANVEMQRECQPFEQHSVAEAYLEPSGTSEKEFLCKNSLRLKANKYFRKKTPCRCSNGFKIRLYIG